VPVYAFACDRCGDFDVMRPMAEAAGPAMCPTCGSEARRVFTPPGLRTLPVAVRTGLEMEEKSAHEPDVVATKTGRPLPHRHDPTPPWVLSH
jgi:putative FmdB family regulatory protein